MKRTIKKIRMFQRLPAAALACLAVIFYAATVEPSYLPVTGSNIGIGTSTPVGALTVMNGNVGIGTWSPTQRLQVVGTVSATAFVGDGSGLTGISAGGWTDGGTNVYTSTTTDLVAIGTTTPVSTLTVKGNIGVGTTLPYQTIAAPANGMVVEGNVGVGTFAASNGKLIVMGGNVGIGLAAPTKPLHVTKTFTSVGTNDGVYFDIAGEPSASVATTYKGLTVRMLGGDSTHTTTTYSGIDVTAQPNAGLANIVNGGLFSVYAHDSYPANSIYGIYTWAQNDAAGKASTGGSFNARGSGGGALTGVDSDVYNTGTSQATSIKGVDVSAGTSSDGAASIIYGGYYSVYNSSGVASVNNAYGNYIEIDAGIGITNGYGLYIADIGATNDYGVFQNGTNDTNYFAGNIGVGTFIAQSRLVVNGGVGIGTLSTSTFINTTAPSGGLIVEKNVGIGTTTPVGALTVMNGNVGIGTWSPTQRLQVIGTVNATAFVGDGSGLTGLPGGGGWTDGGTNVYTTATTDNVGIGTTTPNAATLEIVKNAGQPTLKISSTATGGGDALLVSSTGNVGIGTNTPVGALTVMNGNVGIGTWSPRAALEVVGSVLATSFVGDGSGLTNLPGGSSGWTDGGTNVYTTATTDNVGIGTTTPASTLTVKGNVGIGTTTPYTTIAAPANGMIVEGNVGIGTFAASSGKVIVMGGNVGVGTVLPGARLDVLDSTTAGSSSGQMMLRLTGIMDATAGSGPKILFAENTTGLPAAAVRGYTFGGNSTGLAFDTGWTAPATRMVIDNSGNVGIGTVAPARQLHIGRAAVDDGNMYVRVAASGGRFSAFEALSGTTSWRIGIQEGGAGTASGSLLFDSSTYGTNISFTNQGYVGIGTTSPVGALAVMSGNVGIGTWVPASRLNIIGGNVGIGTTTQYRRIAAPTNGMAIEGNVGIGTWAANSGKLIVMGGNVGIGTAAPRYAIEVRGAGNAGGDLGAAFTNTSATGYANNRFVNSVGSDGWIGIGGGSTAEPYSGRVYLASSGGVSLSADSAGADIRFYQGVSGVHTEWARFNTSGNFGIGTTTPVGGMAVMNGNVGIGTWSPTQRLQVIGTVNATAFVGDGSGLTGLPGGGGWTDGGTNVYTTATTDNVGIGTTTPNAATLEIVKNAGQPTLKISSTATGGGDALLVSSTGNVGIGTNTPVGALTVMNGNVGIGTWSPQTRFSIKDLNSAELLDVHGLGSSNLATFQSSTGASIRVIDNNDDLAAYLGVDTTCCGFTGSGSDKPFYIRSANTERMRFTSEGYIGIGTTTPVAGLAVMSGNVGIGTWSPRAALEVVGSVLATSFYGDGSNLTNLPGGATGWSDGGTNVYTTTTTDNVGIGTTTPSSTVEIVKNANPSNPAALMISATATGDGNMMIVTSSGNVGIGTAVPVAGLAVMTGNVGIGTWSPTSLFEVVGGGDSSFSSNVGIGTTSPAYTLEVLGTGRFASAVNTPKISNLTTNGFVKTSGGDGTLSVDTATYTTASMNAGYVQRSTSTTAIGDSSMFQSGTNIGIGTTTPVGAFTVMNGNVGIGTWSPVGTLEVKGTGSAQVTINGASGGCLMFRDTDNAGWTECNALNGVLTCSLDADGLCDGS